MSIIKKINLNLTLLRRAGEKNVIKKATPAGIDPGTFGLRDGRSTRWTSRSLHLPRLKLPISTLANASAEHERGVC